MNGDDGSEAPFAVAVTISFCTAAMLAAALPVPLIDNKIVVAAVHDDCTICTCDKSFA